ncbi:Orotate phosphoribosyltransferase [uncultured archaeon]|nr:Orotate phosphoribosyltransferase [uncultured archaeon]
MKKDLIEILNNFGLIYNVPEADPSISSVDADIKRLLGYPPILRLVCGEIFEQMDKETTCVATSGYSGGQIATAMELLYNLKQCRVRETPKDYSNNPWFDGHVPEKTDKLTFVEDICLKERNLGHMIKAVRQTGAEVAGYIVVVNRRKEAPHLGIPFSYLIDAEKDLKQFAKPL